MPEDIRGLESFKEYMYWEQEDRAERVIEKAAYLIRKHKHEADYLYEGWSVLEPGMVMISVASDEYDEQMHHCIPVELLFDLDKLRAYITAPGYEPTNPAKQAIVNKVLAAFKDAKQANMPVAGIVQAALQQLNQ